MNFETDAPPIAGWRPSIGRLMLGVMIVALFLTEKSRLILLVLAYLLYPIAYVSFVLSKRRKRFSRERPAAWHLAKIAFATVFVGWLILLFVPNVDTRKAWITPTFQKVTTFLIFVPVGLTALVAWPLVPLPRMERRRS